LNLRTRSNPNPQTKDSMAVGCVAATRGEKCANVSTARVDWIPAFISKPTPFETLARSFVTTPVFSGIRFVAAVPSLDDLLKDFKAFGAVASIFRRIPFGTGGWPAPLPVLGDHVPIGNEMS